MCVAPIGEQFCRAQTHKNGPLKLSHKAFLRLNRRVMTLQLLSSTVCMPHPPFADKSHFCIDVLAY